MDYLVCTDVSYRYASTSISFLCKPPISNVNGYQDNLFLFMLLNSAIVNTRVGTLIVATIYLQLIQNRYNVLKFYCPSLQWPALCTTRCQRCGSRRIPLAAPVVLIVRMELSTAWRISGTVLKRMRILGIKWKSQGLKPLWLPLDS